MSLLRFIKSQIIVKHSLINELPQRCIQNQIQAIKVSKSTIPKVLNGATKSFKDLFFLHRS